MIITNKITDTLNNFYKKKSKITGFIHNFLYPGP